MNKNRKIQETPPPTGIYTRFKYHYAKLMASLPGWQPVWFLFVLPVSFLPLLEEVAKPYLLWVRFPDAIFSVFCLSRFAYAIFLSFNVQRQKILAWMGFILVIAYAAGQLVFAANPFFAHLYSTTEQTRPSYLPTTWIRDKLKPAVDEVLVDNSKATSEKHVTPLQIFDGAIFAILAPMKYLLFLPPFILYLLYIISANNFRQVLRETTSKGQATLSCAQTLNCDALTGRGRGTAIRAGLARTLEHSEHSDLYRARFNEPRGKSAAVFSEIATLLTSIR